MLRQKIYQWHRILSLVIAVPVLLWAASGFLHPIMTSFRPKMATQWLQPVAVDSNSVKINLQEVLRINKIDSFTNFRMVHIDTNWFYQIQRGPNYEPAYISTKTGKILHKGDWLYAQYLAKQFLEGQKIPGTKKDSVVAAVAIVADCCDAATSCVLMNEVGAKIKTALLVRSFNERYKSVNKILPVWAVSFDRDDSISIYVETTQDRFALAMDSKRAIFNQVFSLIHTWGWLDFLGKGRLVVEILLNTMALFTVFFGMYIFFTTSSKKAKGNPVMKARKAHRITSISIAFFTIAFVFSGAFHAFSKFKEDTTSQYVNQYWFNRSAIDFNLSAMQLVVKKPITNISLVKMADDNYWQINTVNNIASKKQSGARPLTKDLMKKAVMPAPSAKYLRVNNLQLLANGEEAYAHYLANTFSGNNESAITQTAILTKFEGEYGFVNKLLPVIKVGYASNLNERYYVETASGKLSTRVNDWDMLEGYSFAFLHKHEFLTPLGKGVKDFSTMFWAAAQIALVIVGLGLYFKTRKRKKRTV